MHDMVPDAGTGECLVHVFFVRAATSETQGHTKDRARMFWFPLRAFHATMHVR